jgi:hypothetical protein
MSKIKEARKIRTVIPKVQEEYPVCRVPNFSALIHGVDADCKDCQCGEFWQKHQQALIQSPTGNI